MDVERYHVFGADIAREPITLAQGHSPLNLLNIRHISDKGIASLFQTWLVSEFHYVNLFVALLVETVNRTAVILPTSDSFPWTSPSTI